MSPSVPAHLDAELLTTYLTDHLAAATGVVQRLEQMQEEYTDLPVHGDIATLASTIAGERDRLEELIGELGLHQRKDKQVLGRAAELAGRLKLNGRLTSRSPLSPLLEAELLRGGVTGKLSLWQALHTHAADLGLDHEELARLRQDALDQLDVIEHIRSVVATTAFRPA